MRTLTSTVKFIAAIALSCCNAILRMTPAPPCVDAAAGQMIASIFWGMAGTPDSGIPWHRSKVERLEAESA